MTRKICSSCQTRPADRESVINGGRFCTECNESAGWENTHSDRNHKALLKLGVTRTAEQNSEIKACWMCHPELNEATAGESTPRTGTSRKGIVLHVTARADAKTKAIQVIDQIRGITFQKAERVYRSKKDGLTRLVIELVDGTLTLAWNDQGQYAYDTTSWVPTGGTFRKVRNVAQALRLARGEKA